MNTTLENTIKIISKWNLWAINFDSSLNWMHQIWDNDGLVEHMQSKFRDLQSMFGSAAMIYFFLETDEKNQEKLIAWVMENYKG